MYIFRLSFIPAYSLKRLSNRLDIGVANFFISTCNIQKKGVNQRLDYLENFEN